MRELKASKSGLKFSDEVGTMTVMYDQCSGLTEVPEF